MAWDYKREESKFEEIPAGRYRVRIKNAEKAVSKNGNDMLTLTLEVSGYSSTIWHHIVFLVDKPEITNRKLTQVFDSFGIEDGDFELAHWIGKVGGAETKVDEYGAKVRYFLSRKQQETLPPWKGKAAEPAPVMTPVDDDKLPF